MDKFLNDHYEYVELKGEMKDLILSSIKQNAMAKKVLAEIAKSDPVIKGEDMSLNGVTKEIIRTSIYTVTTRAPRGEVRSNLEEKEIRRVHPSIKVIDDAIAYLDGATLIYYEKALKEKRWRLTVRGFQIINALMDEGEVTM